MLHQLTKRVKLLTKPISNYLRNYDFLKVLQMPIIPMFERYFLKVIHGVETIL